MNNHDFTASFTVDKSPQEVFAAINHVRGWWSEDIDGHTDQLGAEFKYRYKNVHLCTLQIVELVPEKKVTWLVGDNFFSFTEDKTEWKGTKIQFEIFQTQNGTEVRFTHKGLVPAYECYSACSDGWSTYIKGSLRNLILTGQGQPNIGKAVTESERALTT
jgi:uncharacterized protein YndB with AHSA1/START domain